VRVPVAADPLLLATCLLLMLTPAGAPARVKLRISPESLSVAEATTVRVAVLTTVKLVAGRVSTGALLGSVRSSRISKSKPRRLRPRLGLNMASPGWAVPAFVAVAERPGRTKVGQLEPRRQTNTSRADVKHFLLCNFRPGNGVIAGRFWPDVQKCSAHWT